MASIRQHPFTQQPPAPLGFFARWRKRVRNSTRQALDRGDLTTMIILWALLVIPIFALDVAGWAEGMLSLLMVAFFAAGIGYFLAWSNLSEAFALLVSSFYGFAIIGVSQVLFVAEGNSVSARIVNVIDRINEWSVAVNAGSTSDDDLIFVLFMAILFWFLGHNLTWHVFRIDRVWRAIIPPGLVLLINNFYYLEDQPLEIFLVMYVFLALLLIVRSHVDAREYEWYRNKVRYPRHMRQYFLRVGAGMAIIFVLVGWVLPSGRDQDNMDRFNAFLDSLSRLSETWNKLFSSLESQGIASSDYYGGDQLELSGAIQLGDQPVMEIEAPATSGRYYWRSTVYDTYVGGTWQHHRSVRATKDDDGLRLNVGEVLAGARQTITQTIRWVKEGAASTLIYAAPQPIEFGLPVTVELDCVTNLGSTACVNNSQEVDMSIARALEPIRQGDDYTMQSSVSIASADALRTAAQDYPEWVRARYLQGAEFVTPRLRDLTVQIIAQAGAATPYDKAKAIERWLRTNIAYNETIPAPPEGFDPVDWVVFDLREGYCNYYASAMILMLRSEGIPARMAAGFSQGSFDPERNVYIVKERDAHTWVEVYFPGYGWVEFEPTADENPLDRQGDLPPPEAQPTVTPLPSATPTPTLPPTATSLPPAEGGQPTPTPLQNEQIIPPTLTPTATPTRLPTLPPSPTPPPQQETQIPSADDNGLLKILLYAFASACGIVVLLILSVVFFVWWVEHRGLGGLTMTEKAYARLAIYAKWLHITLPPQHTPEERRRTLVTNVPEGEAPISDITQFYVQARFAPPQKARPDAQAGEAWTAARMAFIKRKIKGWFGR